MGGARGPDAESERLGGGPRRFQEAARSAAPPAGPARSARLEDQQVRYSKSWSKSSPCAGPAPLLVVTGTVTTTCLVSQGRWRVDWENGSEEDALLSAP